MPVTDADRKYAENLAYGVTTTNYGAQAIAEALASERRRALAPIHELANELATPYVRIALLESDRREGEKHAEDQTRWQIALRLQTLLRQADAEDVPAR